MRTTTFFLSFLSCLPLFSDPVPVPSSAILNPIGATGATGSNVLNQNLPSSGSVYTHPGVVISQGGSSWIGSDHLLNLSKNLPIVVEVIKPEGITLPFDDNQLKTQLEDTFKNHGFITNNSDYNTETPGIPFFHLLIVVYPVEQGYVASIDGQLMESVDPLRVRLEKDTFFQAVTWEKKTLIIAPTNEFKALVNKTIDDITTTFFERYDYFDKLKTKLENKTSTPRMK